MNSTIKNLFRADIKYFLPFANSALDAGKGLKILMLA
jgi:hypothetical protein